jgi:hypothetical protein
MLRLGAYILIIIAGGMLIIFLLGKPSAKNKGEDKPLKKQLILHRQGKAKALDEQGPYFRNIVEQCERLFAGADSSPRLIINADRIEQIRKKQTALELILPRVQTITLKNGQSIYYTKLLIPLSDEFSNGTVFFAGAYSHTLGGKEPEYSSLLEYGPINFVRNTQGIQTLKQSLINNGVEITLD